MIILRRSRGLGLLTLWHVSSSVTSPGIVSQMEDKSLFKQSVHALIHHMTSLREELLMKISALNPKKKIKALSAFLQHLNIGIRLRT